MAEVPKTFVTQRPVEQLTSFVPIRLVKFILAICLFAGSNLSAVGQLDSLHQNLQITSSPLDKVNIMNSIFDLVRYDSMSLSKTYAIQSLHLSENLEDNLVKAKAFYNVGTAFYDERKIDTSNYYFHRALAIYQEQQDTIGIVRCLRDIGLNFYTKTQHLSAQQYYIRALKIAEKYNYKDLINEINNQIAFIYIEQEQFDRGLEYLLKSYRNTKSNVNIELVKTLFNIANVLERSQKYPEALIYLDTMIIHAELLEFNFGIAKAHGMKSFILNELKRFDEADASIDEAIRIFGVMGAEVEVFQLIVAKARVDQEQGEFNNMYQEIQKAISFVEGLDDFSLLFEFYDAQYTCYKNLGLFDKALMAHENLSGIRDSIFNVSNAKGINELTT